jgi:catechol 2,3-dioxygenase-like lactoylglutathione lyase family enzyme
MKFKLPLIVVNDIEASRRFYEDVLHQKVILDFGANITFEGEFSLQSKASWAEFINKPENEIVSKPDNFELYFEEDRFDKFVERLKSFEITYLHNVVEYPWGQRVIRFYDPDMNIIEVGESMENVVRRFIEQGFSIEETAERTQHPIEFVKRCLVIPKDG